MRAFFSLIISVIILSSPAQAQGEASWVQIEAQPSLTRAQESIRQYAANLQDVNGFSIGAGWYAISLGPYSENEAEQVLRVYRAERLIPRDSYISVSSDYRQQFWPVGANLLNQAALNLGEVETAQPTPEPQPEPDVIIATVEPEPEPIPEPAD
jgi:hypothetical protein